MGSGCGACNAAGHREAITVIWLSIWGGHVSHIGVQLMWKRITIQHYLLLPGCSLPQRCRARWCGYSHIMAGGDRPGAPAVSLGLVLIGGVEQSVAKEALKWRCNVASMFWLGLCQKWIRNTFFFLKSLQPKNKGSLSRRGLTWAFSGHLGRCAHLLQGVLRRE